MLSENPIQDKVHYIVSDNTSNMRKALSYKFSPGPRDDMESWLTVDNSLSDITLTVEDNESVLDDPTLFQDLTSEEFEESVSIAGERIPCFAHSIQLTIRAGLEKTFVSRTAVAKCVKLANLLHQSALF